MNKRQRKKAANKYGSVPGHEVPVSELLTQLRQGLSPAAVAACTADINTALDKLRDYMAYCRETEIERIKRGPMRWVGHAGYRLMNEAEQCANARNLIDHGSSKATGRQVADISERAE